MTNESMIAELEQEARLMRLRNERLERELLEAERTLTSMHAKLSAAWREADYWKGLHAKLLEQVRRNTEDDWK